MVFVGDGYTAADLGTLHKHAQAEWDEIAASAPWNKYKSFINVWLVNVISNESGVDNDPSRASTATRRWTCTSGVTTPNVCSA